jgi:hypothetical protein
MTELRAAPMRVTKVRWKSDLESGRAAEAAELSIVGGLQTLRPSGRQQRSVDEQARRARWMNGKRSCERAPEKAKATARYSPKTLN